MKRKILIIFFGILVFGCLFAASAFATVDYSEVATLADGTQLPIYDEECNPLIWYVSGVDADGKNVYKSVPNNRNEPNASKDTYVTYVSTTGTWAQLKEIYIHIYNDEAGEYISTVDDNLQIVVLNLREFDMIYLGDINTNHIQYMYFPATLKDCPEKFKGKTALRLVDMSICESLVGGFGGTQNFKDCHNLHTVRLPIGPSYTFEGKNNWKFKNTAISSIVIPEAVVSIGTDNFYGCKSLESVYILGNTTRLGQRNFEGCTSLTNIYFLGENCEFTMTELSENFVSCVNEGKTLDFSNVGKYFFFVTTDAAYLENVKNTIGATEVVPYSTFIANMESYTDGRYVISGTNICDVYYGSHTIREDGSNECVGTCDVCGLSVVAHSDDVELSVSVEYADYSALGTKIVSCSNPGCTYNITTSLPALFTCLGYSAPETGKLAISLGFKVNNAAIAEYKELTGVDVKYGVFAASFEKLGNGDIFENGTANANAICAEINTTEFSVFDLKITGFTDAQKGALLALGAYVSVTKDGATEYSYMQDSTKGEKIGNYFFASFNDIIK